MDPGVEGSEAGDQMGRKLKWNPIGREMDPGGEDEEAVDILGRKLKWNPIGSQAGEPGAASGVSDSFHSPK